MTWSISASGPKELVVETIRASVFHGDEASQEAAEFATVRAMLASVAANSDYPELSVSASGHSTSIRMSVSKHGDKLVVPVPDDAEVA